MENSNHISIVIVSYNVKQLLLQCLKSIFANKGTLLIDVIVIDNNSADCSVEAVKIEYPQVLIIENNFNAGFSGANNQGIGIAKGDYVFLLNPDTEIIGDALQQLKEYISNHADCSIVVPQLLNSDTTIQTSVWENHHPFDLIFETFYFHILFQRLNYSSDWMNTTFEVKTASGAALFFRRELIHKIGMLDENLFWMEDIDFCFRASKLGSIWYLNTAKVIHHSGQSQKKNYNIAISNQLISKLKYYKKYSSVAGFGLAIFFCFIFILLRIVAFSLIMPFKKIWRLKAQAYLYAFKKYFNYLILNDNNIVR